MNTTWFFTYVYSQLFFVHKESNFLDLATKVAKRSNFVKVGQLSVVDQEVGATMRALSTNQTFIGFCREMKKKMFIGSSPVRGWCPRIREILDPSLDLRQFLYPQTCIIISCETFIKLLQWLIYIDKSWHQPPPSAQLSSFSCILRENAVKK